MNDQAGAPSHSYINAYHKHDFAAQEAMVEIIPRFSMNRVSLVSGSVGPFVPNYPMEVPLWLALYCRASNMCTIKPPDLLSVAALQKAVDHEMTVAGFAHVPFHFFSLAKMLLRHAAADVPDANEVHRLVIEWQQRRELKLRNQLGLVANEGPVQPLMQVANLSSAEIEAARIVTTRVPDDASLFVFLAMQQRPHKPTGRVSASHVAESTLRTADLGLTGGTFEVPAPIDDGISETAGAGSPSTDAALPTAKRRRTLRQR